jgi:hypothetical protein
VTLIVPTMFAATVVAVNPMVSVLGPMAGHPNHFVVALPVTRAMIVKRPVTDFDPNFLRLQGGPESKARSGDRHEKQYFLNHTCDSCGERALRAGYSLFVIRRGESVHWRIGYR